MWKTKNVNLFNYMSMSTMSVICSAFLAILSISLLQFLWNTKTSSYSYFGKSFICSSWMWQYVVFYFQLFIGVCIFQTLILDRFEVPLQYEFKFEWFAWRMRRNEVLKSKLSLFISTHHSIFPIRTTKCLK